MSILFTEVKRRDHAKERADVAAEVINITVIQRIFLMSFVGLNVRLLLMNLAIL